LGVSPVFPSPPEWGAGASLPGSWGCPPILPFSSGYGQFGGGQGLGIFVLRGLGPQWLYILAEDAYLEGPGRPVVSHGAQDALGAHFDRPIVVQAGLFHYLVAQQRVVPLPVAAIHADHVRVIAPRADVLGVHPSVK